MISQKKKKKKKQRTPFLTLLQTLRRLHWESAKESDLVLVNLILDISPFIISVNFTLVESVSNNLYIKKVQHTFYGLNDEYSLK